MNLVVWKESGGESEMLSQRHTHHALAEVSEV